MCVCFLCVEDIESDGCRLELCFDLIVALKKDGVVNEKVAFVNTHPFVHFGNIF